MYETLRKMVGRELEAILLNEDMEELLLVLQEKQEVISRLQLLSDSWADLLSSFELDEPRGSSLFWDKLSALFPAEKAAEFESTLKQTRAAAEDLMEAEEKVQTELEKHVQQLRGKMLQMNKGRSAFIGYTKMGGAHLERIEPSE